MASEQTPSPNSAENPPDVRIHYIKGNQFRVIRVDGALGAPSPCGDIHMALYNERFPIPIQTIHRIGPDGTVDRHPQEAVAREGLVREVEADLVFSPKVARALAKWLLTAAETSESALQVGKP